MCIKKQSNKYLKKIYDVIDLALVYFINIMMVETKFKYNLILKLRLFLVFVIVYIVAVFGWWLYSFIRYTEKEYKLEYNNLKLNSFVIHNQVNEYIDKLQGNESESPYSIYKKHEKIG